MAVNAPIVHLKLKATSRKSIGLDKALLFFSNTREMSIKVWLVGARRLAHNILLGTIFIAKFFEGRLLQGRTLTPRWSKLASISGSRECENMY